VECKKKSNKYGQWVAKIPKLLAMAPETRLERRNGTRSSSTASTLAKKKCEMESRAVARMPPKNKLKKSVKVAKKGKVAKGKQTAKVDKGEEGNIKLRYPDQGICAACGKPGGYG
jgi:hypothetical protein